MIQVAETIALRVAKRYARRCWWAEEDDLRQEAREAAARAMLKWDSRVGVPFQAYAWCSCARAVQNLLWRQSSPVSAPKNKLPELAGIWRAPNDAVLKEYATPVPAPDQQLESALYAEAVREQVQFVLEDEDPIVVGWAMRVLLGEEPMIEVAETEGVRLHDLRIAMKRVRGVLREDARLFELWRNP